MKRLILAGAMAVAACTGAPDAVSTTEPPDGGRVVLGSFTGEADLEAGTLSIRSLPVSAVGSVGMKHIATLDADVTVANNGAVWMNKTDGCGAGLNSWGASVNVTSILPATLLSGVYAEITTISSIGSAGCNSAIAPTGLSAAKGLWSYGEIAAGITKAVTWEFSRESGARVTFSGRIVGVKVDPANVQSGTQREVAFSALKMNAIAGYDTTLVVAGRTSGIDFVDSSTGAFSKTVTTTAAVTALAVAPTRIWYVATPTATGFDIGWMDRDGSNRNSSTVVTTPVTLVNGGAVNTIIPHPGNANKVWLLGEDNSSHSYLWSYTIGTGLGSGVTIEGLAYAAAIGSDNRIYVPAGYWATPFSIATDPATPETATYLSNCSLPFYFFPGGSSNFYISCRGNNRVTSMTEAGGLGLVGDISSPFGFGVSGSEVWAATSTGIRRVAASPYDATIPGGTTYAVTLANGYLWTNTNGLLWRVRAE